MKVVGLGKEYKIEPHRFRSTISVYKTEIVRFAVDLSNVDTK